jgi:hypothetical protein
MSKVRPSSYRLLVTLPPRDDQDEVAVGNKRRRIQSEALVVVQALALRVLADRLEHAEAVPEELLNMLFVAA